MAKRKEDEVKPGAPAWQSTFADLMNLLLCFFVLLFSMSTVDAQKFEMIAASFNQTFSIFTAGASAIGDGVLVSNGVSQLNELDNFINSTGKMDNGETVSEDVAEAAAEAMKEALAEAMEAMEEAQMEESEQMAEAIQEAIDERDLAREIDVDFTAQYVQLTLKGSLLFDSGSTELKADVLPVLDQVGIILERYAESTIEIEGHTDNVPMSGAKYSNNDELSSGRALSVFNYLLSVTNLDPALVKHSGRGEYVPVADNSTAEGRTMNRRVEIKIYNSLSSY
ncbi:MAG: flagellar motor protein MotB [Ruminococcus sp.]|nr:flagellar motor protein MotB [Ruminococcus sp.]